MSAPARFNPDLLWDLDIDELRAIAQTVTVGKFRLQVDLDTNSREEDCRCITLSRGGQNLAQVTLSLDKAGGVVTRSSAVNRGADAPFSRLAMDLVETLTGKMSEAAEARERAKMEARRAEDAEIEADLQNSLTYLGM